MSTELYTDLEQLYYRRK